MEKFMQEERIPVLKMILILKYIIQLILKMLISLQAKIRQIMEKIYIQRPNQITRKNITIRINIRKHLEIRMNKTISRRTIKTKCIKKVRSMLQRTH